jgi:hypothetical protein
VCGIPGVREIAYDHWLMPAIYVRVEEPFEEVLEKVKKEIAKYAH